MLNISGKLAKEVRLAATSKLDTQFFVLQLMFFRQYFCSFMVAMFLA